MTAWLRRLGARIRHRHFERDLAREIEFHREMKEQALRSDGVSAEEARHRAMRELGNVMLMREAAREVWIAPWLESIWQDIRYAFRNLRNRPGFTLAASTTLLLGIGLSTSLFTVYDAPGLRQEGASSPDLLRSIADTLEATGIAPVGVAAVPPLKFSSMAVRVRLPGESDAVWRQVADRPVSNGYFTVLNIPLAAGRWFSEHALKEREAIVNETFARLLWPGGQAVGRIFVDVRKGSNFTVIGVVKDCHEAGPGEIPAILHTQEPLDRWSHLLVRGEDEVTAERIRTVSSRIAGTRVTMAPLREYLRESLQISIVGMGVSWALGLLGLVLAVVGIFGVISYVVQERRREIGIRLALGARGSQVVGLILRQTRLATLDFLAALCTHVPDSGQQLIRYYGAWSNARRVSTRAAASAPSPAAEAPGMHRDDYDSAEEFARARRRSWARLIKKVYEARHPGLSPLLRTSQNRQPDRRRPGHRKDPAASEALGPDRAPVAAPCHTTGPHYDEEFVDPAWPDAAE